MCFGYILGLYSGVTIHEQLFSLISDISWLCRQCPGSTIVALKSFVKDEKIGHF